MSAYTPRASLSVGGNRGFAAIVLTDTAAQLCAAFFDRPGYPAPRCTFRPAFTAMMLCWCDITRHSPEHPKTVLSKSRHAAAWRAIAGDQEDLRTV
jgi:hypothetical protein